MNAYLITTTRGEDWEIAANSFDEAASYCADTYGDVESIRRLDTMSDRAMSETRDEQYASTDALQGLLAIITVMAEEHMDRIENGGPDAHDVQVARTLERANDLAYQVRGLLAKDLD